VETKLNIYIDIDNTICFTNGQDYSEASPNYKAILKVNCLYEAGHKIVMWTARGVVSGIDWRPLTESQLKDWGVKYHELRLDKAPFDLLIDDKVLNSIDWLNE
jgi:hypothetical protein